MKAPKFKLADNDMWDLHVIGSNLSSSHPPHKGKDANEMRALGVSGRAGVVHRRICPAVEVEGGERERGSRDRRWRKVGEATFVWCEEVMDTPQRMEAGLLGQ